MLVLLGIVGAFTGILGDAGPLAANSEKNRVLSIYNIHNKERVTVTYKRNGKYQSDALKKLNWVMRDWRRNEATKMDPKLFDIIWEIHTELGSKEPVHLISGYRSRKTNNGLRKTRGGQAKNSRHIVGKAADIHFPDVPVRRLRYSALVKERGGVGYYPTSALPFVHVDTGRVRHWPRIGRDELALLTRGRSKHIPRGGRPVTKADYRRARAKNKKLAQRIALFHSQRARKPARTVVASLAGGLPKNWSIPKPKVATAPAKPRKRIKTAALTPSTVPAPALATRPAKRNKKIVAWPKADVRAPDVQVKGDLFSGLDSDDDDPTREALPKPILPEVRSTDGNIVPPPPGRAPRRSIKIASLGKDDLLDVLQPARPTPSRPLFELTGWATAPSYDDEHAAELSYRPFPIGPFLTLKPSIDDPAVARLVHPDLAGSRNLIGRHEEDIPLRFKPGLQYAKMLWSDIFTNSGEVDLLDGDPELGGERRRVAQQ